MVATCIAIAGRQPRLARRAIITLAAGLGAAELAVLATATVLKLAGDLKSDLGDAGLGGLTHADLTTVIIALAAGVAGVLAFQAKAGSTVGVAISVTTIPAVAYLGVAAVTDHGGDTLGAVGVLITNVLCVIVAGTATIATQDRIRRRHRPRS